MQAPSQPQRLIWHECLPKQDCRALNHSDETRQSRQFCIGISAFLGPRAPFKRMAEGPGRQVSDACVAQGGSKGSAGAGCGSERGLSGAVRAGEWRAVLEGFGFALRQSRSDACLPS